MTQQTRTAPSSSSSDAALDADALVTRVPGCCCLVNRNEGSTVVTAGPPVCLHTNTSLDLECFLSYENFFNLFALKTPLPALVLWLGWLAHRF